MRTEKEMLDILVTFAKEHEAIKVVGMEGSRVHPEIKKDHYKIMILRMWYQMSNHLFKRKNG